MLIYFNQVGLWCLPCASTIHFNKLTFFILLQLFQFEECISFDAQQKVPVGLLQPAPAVFYDYYEPSRTICFCLFFLGRLKPIFCTTFLTSCRYTVQCVLLCPQKKQICLQTVFRRRVPMCRKYALTLKTPQKPHLGGQDLDLPQKYFNFFLGPCHKLQNTFRSQNGRYIKKYDRLQHACFVPTVDYGQNHKTLHKFLKKK